MALDIEGKIYRVGKTQHVKPGKGGAYVQVQCCWCYTAASMSKWPVYNLLTAGGAEGDQDGEQNEPPLPRR